MPEAETSGFFDGPCGTRRGKPPQIFRFDFSRGNGYLATVGKTAVATGNQVNKSVIIITRLSRSSHRMNKERK